MNKATYSDEFESQLALFHSNQSIDKNQDHLIQINKKFGLKYQKKDKKHLNNLIKLMDCLKNQLNKSHFNNSTKWIQPYAVLGNERSGKSVYNTDIVKAYNQHYSETPYLCTKVSLEKGFVSHYRDVQYFHNQVDLAKVMIDLENYYFLRNIY